MRNSLTLGKISGIEIKLHYSWFFIFVLVVFSLVFGYMPHHYPDLNLTTYWIIGSISAGILFSSVLFHELSHSYVAIRRGMRIPSIVLFFFGGVAQMVDEPRRPEDEMKVSAAGPLFSFAVGGALLFLWYFSQSLSLRIELSAIFLYGGSINLLLGGFNMMPAFPLDGGRILRAFLWRRSSHMVKATVSAVSISMIFAYTLIFGSFPVLFLTHDASGIWLFFIGMFLRSSAEASLQQTLLRHYLKGVYAGQMATLPSFIAPRTTLSEFDETYGRSKQKRFPVLHNAILVGVFEPRDMKKVPRQDWSSVLAEDLVRPTDEYVMISADTPAIEIPMRMVRAQASEVFVVKDGRFLGTITYHDLLSYVRTINSLKQS